MDFVYHLIDESELKEQTGFLEADATLTHVEEGLVVELTHSGAVGAFHIVGVDLKYGLGVHPCLTGDEEVLVALLRHGLLGFRTYQYLTGEGSCGILVEDVLVELAAGAVGGAVVDKGVVVHMLRLVGYHAAVAGALCSLALKGEDKAVAGNAVV